MTERHNLYNDNKALYIKRAKRRKKGAARTFYLLSGVVSILIALVVLGTLLYTGINEKIHAYDYKETAPYTIQRGDTLWTIARKYSSERQDVSKVIELIEDINDCGATIFPNDSIEVPLFTNMGRR